MLLLKHILGNFPQSLGIQAGHFCSEMITGRLLVLAQPEKGCILLLLHYVAALTTQNWIPVLVNFLYWNCPSSSTEKRNDLIPHCEVTDSLFGDGVDKIRCSVFLPTTGGYHSNTSGYQPEPVAAQRYLWLCRHLWWSSSVWVILSLLLCQTVIPLPIPTNFPLQPSHSFLLATTFRTL